MTSADGAARASELSTHYAFCEAAVREKDRDSWLAALFAPAGQRKHLHAIRAFLLEIAEAREKVTQPLLGEMRLRWWADTIGQPGVSGAHAHPVADALMDTIAKNRLAPGEFQDFLDARIVDFYDDQMESVAALLEYCGKAHALPLRWTAQCLGANLHSGATAAIEYAGAALGITKILWGLRGPGDGTALLPLDILARHNVSPDDLRSRRASKELRAALAELRKLAHEKVEAARGAAPRLDEAARTALLFSATAPLYLERMEASESQPFGTLPAPSPWRRQWRLWRASRAGL